MRPSMREPFPHCRYKGGNCCVVSGKKRILFEMLSIISTPIGPFDSPSLRSESLRAYWK